MSIFNKSGFSFRLYDRESYVVTRDGRTAAELMEGEKSAVSGALPKSKLTPKAAFQGTGAYQPRNPKFANFASPSASGSFGGGKSLYTSPSFYSPIHTATNWQIPTKRREVYLWNRFFAQNDPTVASSLRFYSQFPFSGFDNVMNDPIRKEHFDKVKKRLDLERWMPLIAYEYFGMGDAFPFISIDCPECAGFGKKPDGTVCKHHNEDAAIASVTVLNPDWVEVKINPLNPADPIISLLPDDTLKTIVFSKEPPEVYERIPVFIRQMIMQNKPIPLNRDSVTHLKHDEIPYLPYGRSLICPLFPMLAYQDKLRQAQWIVADRHILPIKICKIGNDQRPAGPQDISDTQAQLGATANDPNLTLVTHHAFQFEWVGSCYTENVEVMTKRGFLKYTEVTEEDEIATYSEKTKQLEYCKYINKFEYDYNSETDPKIHKYKSKHIEVEVTENHKMYADLGDYNNDQDKYEYNKNYNLVESKDITKKSKFKFLNTLDFIGVVPEKLDYQFFDFLKEISLEDWCDFVGWYLSEGGLQRNSYDKNYSGVSLSQNLNGKNYKNIENMMNKVFKKYRIYTDDRCDEKRKNININFKIDHSEFSRFIAEEFGATCGEKKIPVWMKNLPKEFLQIILNSMMMGDGNVKLTKTKKIKNNRYSTTSKQLSDDTQEVIFKLGFFPTISFEERKEEQHSDMYRILWSDNSKVKNGNDLQIQRNRSKVEYKGKVWCFEVPNHIFIVRCNGKIGIHGNSGKVLQLTKEYELIDKAMIKGLGVNEALLSGTGPSYSQAAIGIEATIKRLKTVQKIMANWIIDKIYKVEARMRGFYKEDLQGNKILDYPDIRWDDLNLRDESQKNGLYMQLLDKKIVSAQFLCEKLDIDYDVETERVRLESEFQQQLGIAPDGGGKPGGGKPPGLGGGFGGGGGGAMPPPAAGGAKPGMPGAGGGMKGNLPGGQSAPGLPGDSLAPSMSGGEAGDYELKLKSHEQAKETAPQVHRPRKYKLVKPKEPKIQEPEQEVNGVEIDMDQIHQFRLTSIEAKLYQAIRKGQGTENLPADILFQQKPEPEQMSRVTVDAFSPSLKIIFEADGKLYHSSPEQIARDQERDSRFQQLGWIVVRFTEDQINYQIEKVLSTMIQAANELTERNQQHFSDNNNGLEKIAKLEGIEEYNFEEDMIEENEEGFEQGDY